MSSSAPPPLGPGAPSGAGDTESRGVLKFGLVGCAALSVVAIVGMVLFMRKAPELMGKLLGATEAQVVAAIAPDVPAEDREAFRREYAAFVGAAKAGRAKPESIQSLQKKIAEALKDDKVTAEELRGLTDALRAIPKP